ncbi:hypothetical protein ABIA69_004090 [Lysinibacillus parviboronicapiens]|uniref:Uncharacterized protein n=1 Tax=Lysinibacillus parviboronicapiens TaxID=436516 RepID=A0ABV2PQ30_9BACI
MVMSSYFLTHWFTCNKEVEGGKNLLLFLCIINFLMIGGFKNKRRFSFVTQISESMCTSKKMKRYKLSAFELIISISLYPITLFLYIHCCVNISVNNSVATFFPCCTHSGIDIPSNELPESLTVGKCSLNSCFTRSIFVSCPTVY